MTAFEIGKKILGALLIISPFIPFFVYQARDAGWGRTTRAWLSGVMWIAIILAVVAAVVGVVVLGATLLFGPLPLS